MTDQPVVKPRKHPHLWQSYLWYSEIMDLRKAHVLRISAIERGASDMDAEFEKEWLEATNLDRWKKELGKVVANNGALTGEIWTWITQIRGLKSGLLPAQLLAQIDDIEKFDTISKLWRFCGYAVFDGKAEPKESFKAPHDEKSGRHYNGRLKGVCFNIADAFIKQQTPYYVDIYYAEKLRQRELHPVVLCKECEIECIPKGKKKKGKEVGTFVCPNNGKHATMYTKNHFHFRAIRKMMKAFLKDLWLAWREAEGLSVTEEWKEEARLPV